MKLKVKQSLIYCGIVYNPGEVVEIIESDVIERVKSLELVETEEVTETEETNSDNEEKIFVFFNSFKSKLALATDSISSALFNLDLVANFFISLLQIIDNNFI